MNAIAQENALAILRKWAAAPNEITSAPWWAITVQSKIGHRGEVMLAGPYFSREDAQAYLNAHCYRFPKKARVYCFSGHDSPAWRELRRAAINLSGGAS